MSALHQDDSETQKAIRFVDFLTKIAELRATKARDFNDYEKVIWIHDVPKQKGCFARAWGSRLDADADIWVEIQAWRGPEPILPGIPSVCEKWLGNSALLEKSRVPELRVPGTESPANPNRRDQSDELPFDSETENNTLGDFAEAQRAWQRYIENKWLPWREKHNEWETGPNLYPELFTIHQEQLKDSEKYELVMTFGLLVWQTPTGQRIRRHLLVADANLEFEASKKKFAVRAHPEGANLRIELDMLNIEEQPAHAEKLKVILSDAGDDPWEKGCVESVLKSLVHSIDPRGEYRDSLDPTNIRATDKPVVVFAPAIILRQRSTKGLTHALERIKKRIKKGEKIPDEFRDLAGIGRRRDHDSGDGQSNRKIEFDGEIFFPKPSNEEQRRIVEKMRATNGILVQGPPGTGKSHTIANLICHLLATGQRMLVTAKTPRALQVLEDLLPQELRPLCISMLGDGQKERRSLESSVRRILAKKENWNEEQADYERDRISGHLGKLRDEKAEIGRRLRSIRESETHAQSVAEGTYRGTAARITEEVNRDRSTYEWFRDEVPREQPCPCTGNELFQAKAGLQTFLPERRRELDGDFINPDDLISPEVFSGFVSREKRAIADEEHAKVSFILWRSVATSRRRRQRRDVEDEIVQTESIVRTAAAHENAHPIVRELLTAIRNRNLDDYAIAFGRMERLCKKKRQLERFDKTTDQLRRSFPKLMGELEQSWDDPVWNERLAQIRDAWHWGQARDWVEEYVRREDEAALSKRIIQIEDEINATLAKLASLHAWSCCFARLKEDHRKHMGSWQRSMRRLGKGTGKHAPRYRREAQDHLNRCREAVPAWVMPLHRVWDTIEPAPEMFDVIIVDEASQCGLESLLLFYLGKKILIVGDDKQISPEAVGLDPNEVELLKNEHLGDDFPFKSEFNRETSLFDHGDRQFRTSIRLREHFRCMPEIIRFSNNLCYSDAPLIPLRQYGPDRLNPLERIFVERGNRQGKDNRVINRPEAEAIVKKIAELCHDPRYDAKTMGVIILQGEAQAGLIEGMLREHERVGAEEMERRRLICGNPYSFQGDERDIIFLSLVAASDERIGTLTKESDQRRFNVAASRARDQMVLFHSVRRDDLGASCLRRKLLEYFENPESPQIAEIDRDELERRAFQDNRQVVRPPKPFDSWFEVEVALELLRSGFRVIPQFEVAGKRIDLVVEGGQAKLAVECDGDEWHGADQYEKDMERQRQLERCGLEFFRVRESAFYANRSEALSKLWEILEERGIFPGYAQVADGPKPDTQAIYDIDDTDEKNNVEVVRPDDDPKDSENTVGEDSERKRLEDVSASDIQNAILRVLENCPNHSSTLNSMTKHVLSDLGILTHGKPRKAFEARVKRSIGILEQKKLLQQYKAKNRRVRLIREKR